MRKKITLLTTTYLMACIIANAQINSGRYLLGADLNFRTENNKDFNIKNEGFSTNIKLGKVIKENTVAGINISYGNSIYEYLTNPRQKFLHYGAGIFYRKYKSLSKSFHLFGEGSLNYAHSTTTQTTNQDFEHKAISNGALLNLTPGLSYSLSKRMFIEMLFPNLFSINYAHEKIELKHLNEPVLETQRKNVFSLGTNLDGNLLSNFGIGFKFILGK